MELNKKTTVLFSETLHRQLSELAARRGVSLGELVREACAAQYGIGAARTGEKPSRRSRRWRCRSVNRSQ